MAYGSYLKVSLADARTRHATGRQLLGIWCSPDGPTHGCKDREGGSEWKQLRGYNQSLDGALEGRQELSPCGLNSAHAPRNAVSAAYNHAAVFKTAGQVDAGLGGLS